MHAVRTARMRGQAQLPPEAWEATVGAMLACVASFARFLNVLHRFGAPVAGCHWCPAQPNFICSNRQALGQIAGMSHGSGSGRGTPRQQPQPLGQLNHSLLHQRTFIYLLRLKAQRRCAAITCSRCEPPARQCELPSAARMLPLCRTASCGPRMLPPPPPPLAATAGHCRCTPCLCSAAG